MRERAVIRNEGRQQSRRMQRNNAQTFLFPEGLRMGDRVGVLFRPEHLCCLWKLHIFPPLLPLSVFSCDADLLLYSSPCTVSEIDLARRIIVLDVAIVSAILAPDHTSGVIARAVPWCEFLSLGRNFRIWNKYEGYERTLWSPTVSSSQECSSDSAQKDPEDPRSQTSQIRSHGWSDALCLR